MSRPLRASILVCSVLGLVAAVIFGLILPNRPLEEVTGLSESTFDDAARGNLPQSATRIMRYTTGFTDSTTWTAYTADRATIERASEALTRKRFEDLPPWDATRAHSLNRPSRAERLNRGYWDVDAVAKGRFYSSFDGSHGLQVLIDTERWRIFIHQFTT